MTSTFLDSLAADRHRTLIADAEAFRLARTARIGRSTRPPSAPRRRWSWTRPAAAHS